jgi:methylmalonyl-CoA mutase
VKKEKLFEQFPPVSTEKWMEKIIADLKGADFNKKLVWKTGEGLEVKPFYRREDLEKLSIYDSLNGEFPYLRGNKTGDNNWHVRQNIEVTDYAEANRKALDILNKGIDSLGFNIIDPGTVTYENFEILLNEIHPEAVELNFLCNGKAKEILDILKLMLEKKGVNPSGLSGAIEADPLGRLMVNGTLCITPEEGFDYLASLTKSALVFPFFRTVHIRASEFVNAGAGFIMELAFGLSMGNEYMSLLTDRGLSASEAASKIRFSFGIGPSYFPEIAKFRAARLLWAVIQKGYGLEGDQIVKMDIHSVTGRWNKTVYDPYVNMLRTQTEAMSAIVGGTDSLTVEAFDVIFKTPDEFSERIARNQQLILKEESHFDKVADPAAGSYYIENLTEMIAGEAWKLYIGIESEGGFLSALRKGFINKKLQESAEKQKADVASRKTVLLGTNQYPKEGETLSTSIDSDKLFIHNNGKGNEVDPILLFRGSEEYEKIRLATAKSGKEPVVFLFTIGNPVMRKARAQFSAGFFGCAGYKVIDNNGFKDVPEGVRSALEAKADIVVICSSDDEYLSFAPGIYNDLKDKAIIVIAGNPASAGELRSAGLDQFIHMRSDVPQTLKFFNERLGIKA